MRLHKKFQKDRANDVAALLSNFDTAIKMVDTAENSFGSASAENEKHLDSLQGRIDVMTASLQAMSTAALDSDFLKGTVSGVTMLIDAFTSLVDTIGLFPTLLGAIGAGFSTFGNKGIVTVDKINGKLNIFGKSLEDIKNSFDIHDISGSFKSLFSGNASPFDDFAARLEKDKIAFENYKKLGDGATVNDVASALSGASDGLRNMAHNGELAAMTWEEFSTKQKKSAVATQASNKSLKSAASLIAEYNNKGRTVGLTQAQFVDAVGKSNTVLGNYLNGLSGTSATMGGYVSSLIGATVKTVALTVASTALNAALTMGVGIAIGAVISGISSLITYYDDLAKSVEESSSAFSQANNTLMSNKTTYDSAVQTYDKLSKGVNSLGENVSLTANEYAEYQNAVNTIADSAPSMVAGFDSQGNAILNTTANVESLTDAYNELIAAEAKAFLKGDEDKGYVGLSKIAEDYAHDLEELQHSDLESYQILDNLLGSSDIESAIEDLAPSDLWNLRDRLKDMGLKQDWGQSDADFIAEAIKSDTDTIRKAVDEQMTEYDNIATEMRQAAEAMLNETLYGDTKLADMSDSVKNMLTQYVSGFDGEFFEQLISKNGGDAGKVDEYLENYMNDITSSFEKLSTTQQQTIADAFDFQGQFEAGEISMNEFASKAKEMDKVLKDIGLDDNARKEMMLSLGFEYDGDNLKNFTKDYETVLNRFGGDKASKEIKDWLGSLSGSELDFVMNMELDGDETIDELQQALDLAKALNGVGTINIAVESEGFDKLNTAIQESNSASGLTAESIESIKSRYSDLAGYDPSAIFEKTTTGVRLNTKALESLEKQYVDTMRAANDQNINALAQEYKRLGEEIDKANAAGDLVKASSLESQQSVIADTIEEAQMAAAAIDGMTSAYNRWLNAQSAGQEGDMYDAIFEGRENATSLAKEGKWGNTELQDYIKMFSAEGSLDNATPQQYADAWASAIQKSNRYFQEGTQGLDNFFADVEATGKNLVAMDENGFWQIQPNVEIEDLAEALGVAESTVEAILGQANEYGADFEIGIDPKSVDELIAESEQAAQAASDALKQYLGEDFEISTDLTVNDVNDAESKLATLQQQRDEINNSDATVEVKEQGVEAVNSAIRAVIAQKIELEQPAFMTIDTSQVDSSMADALAKAQEMQTAINNLNNLQLQQEYGIEIDQSQLDSANQKVQEIAQTIADNGELKMSLGFDESASVDDIKAKFQANEITIPTKADTTQAESDIAAVDDNKTVDIQVNLSGDDKIAALESKMNAIDNKTIDASVSLTGDDKIAALESKMNAIDNKTIDANVNLTGDDKIAALESKMNAIDNKTINATVSVQNSQAITALQNSIASIQSKAINVSVTVSNTPAVTALQNAINTLSGKTVDVTANVTGTSEVNALTAAINKVAGKSVSVTASVSGTSSVNSLANAIASVKSKTVTVTANYQKTGSTDVDGTAHADGNANYGKAFKQGKWGAADSGTALMGELGPEIIVRGDKWFTVGDDGAGFYQYKKGDIIFNHRQSEELLKNGYVTASGGRGRAMAEGTAFASVSGGWKPGGIKPSGGGGTTIINNTTNNYNSGSKSSSSKSSSKSSSSSSSKATKEAEEFEETLDWIEIAIDRIERAIDSLDRTASSAFKSWGERTNALNQQMQKVTDEIALQQQAYDRYMQQANSVGLSSDWANKVMNGTIDISVITDENLKEQIDDFQTWYEKALDAKDAVEELNEQLGELAQQRFENISKQFEGQLGFIEHEFNMIDEFIAQTEGKGWMVSKEFYRAQLLNVEEQRRMLQDQREALLKQLQNDMAAGTIKKGDEAWTDAVNQIDEVSLAIEECMTNMIELDAAIREVDWKVFDMIQERISDITKEGDFLIELMSNEKLYDDRGQLTDKGMATMGLHGMNYNVYMGQADKYAEEIKKIEADLNRDPWDQDLIDRRQELLDLQREAILNAEDEKNAIKDMVEEGIELELDALDELIEKYKDSLQAQKDLYDYSREIEEKTSNIAVLEKQLSAFRGDDSEESQAKIQQIMDELKDAQQDLADAEYDKYISDTERLLDQLYSDYELILNQRLDNIDFLIQNMIDEINANSGMISEVISSEANNVGYELTDQMQQIWNGENQVLTYYGDGFLNSMTNVSSVLNTIDTHIRDMMNKLDYWAQQQIKQDGSSAADSPEANTPVTPPSNNNNNNNNNNNKPKADAYGIAGAIWVLGGGPSGWGNNPTRSSKLTKAYGADFARQVQSIINNTFATGKWDRKRDYSGYTSYKLLGYKSGVKRIDDDQYAWTQEEGSEMIVRPSDGAILTPLAKNDSVLTADATRNIWNMANDPRSFIKDNLGANAPTTPAVAGGNTTYTQNLENVVFNLPNVKNYEQLLASMQKDKNFERLINSMTLDKLAGKNSLGKSKALR